MYLDSLRSASLLQKKSLVTRHRFNDTEIATIQDGENDCEKLDCLLHHLKVGKALTSNGNIPAGVHGRRWMDHQPCDVCHLQGLQTLDLEETICLYANRASGLRIQL